MGLRLERGLLVGFLSRLIRKARQAVQRRQRVLKNALISLDSNPTPVGMYRTFVAGEDINEGDVVSIHTDGRIYKASSAYPNVVGVAIDSGSAGENVRVLVYGAAQVTANGAINPGDAVTWSGIGRVARYVGHSHGRSLSTTDVLSDISISIANAGGHRHKWSEVDALTTTSPSEWAQCTSLDINGEISYAYALGKIGAFSEGYEFYTWEAGGHTHDVSISKTTQTVVNGVSISSTYQRVIGIAITGASGAGDKLWILVIPIRL